MDHDLTVKYKMIKLFQILEKNLWDLGLTKIMIPKRKAIM